MSSVGKFLIFLQLFFSLLFVGFAGAVFTAQNNWRDAHKKSTAELTKEKGRTAEAENKAKADKNAFDQQTAALQDTVTRLTGDQTTLKAEVATLASENKDLRSRLDTEREVARLNSTEAGDRKSESDLTRTKNASLHRQLDELAQKLRSREDEVFGLQQRMVELSKKQNGLLEDVGKMKAFLAQNNLPTDVREMAASITPPPKLAAQVLDVQKSTKGPEELVEISNGSDDGLIRGNELTLFRKDRFLGKIRLVSVDPDRAIGLVISKNKNEKIQKGDNATTEF